MPDYLRGRINGILLSIIGTLLLVIGGFAVKMIQANENSIESNTRRITDAEKIVLVLKEQYKGIKEQLVSIEDKIDNGR
jgi:hypothetical protein